MADTKSETKTTDTGTEPKAAPATVTAAPTAPATPAEAPAAAPATATVAKAEKASEPAPAAKAETAAKPARAAKAVKAARPARAAKAEKAAKPAPTPASPARKTSRKAAAKAAPVRRARKALPVTNQKKPVRKPAAIKSVKAAATRPAAQAARPAVKTLNEGSRIMKNETSKIADRVQTVFGDVNSRAKEAFERNTRVAEEMTEFTKGNVEAFVASTKLVAKGAETLGQEVAEFGRKSFEDASAALKSFAEVKTPADLFRLQSEFARAQFDAFVSESSKLSETVIKLAGDAAQPITSRYAVAAEKAKAVAAF